MMWRGNFRHRPCLASEPFKDLSVTETIFVGKHHSPWARVSVLALCKLFLANYFLSSIDQQEWKYNCWGFITVFALMWKHSPDFVRTFSHRHLFSMCSSSSLGGKKHNLLKKKYYELLLYKVSSGTIRDGDYLVILSGEIVIILLRACHTVWQDCVNSLYCGTTQHNDHFKTREMEKF